MSKLYPSQRPHFTNSNFNHMSQVQHTQSIIFHQNKPLSKINQIPSQQEQSSSQNVQSQQKEVKNNENTKVKQYFYGWLLFILAFIVFLMIWVIGHFSIERLTSYYYFNPYNVSPYVSIDFWKLSARAIGNNDQQEVYISSNTLYPESQLRKADAIALSLLFSWVMWKFPLIFFTLTTMNNKKQPTLRYVTWGFYLSLLLLIDILTTAFKPEGYQDWIYFIVYFVLSVLVVIANGFKDKKMLLNNLRNYLLPILYIIIAYASFVILIPGIYHAIYANLGNDAPFIIVHIFPFIDMIFYVSIILITYYTDSHAIKFTKMLQFLNTGYAVGHVILFSPEDVQFYYLVVYFVVRNFVFNWILQKVQKYVINPVPLPGWIIIYLVSLCINFVPFVGLGKLVVSISFYSQILQLTLPIQSYMLPVDYYAYNLSTLPQISTFNPGLKSNIQLSSVFIIWVLLSISQKYHISKIEIKEIIFYIFGIYLFYFGLTTGTQLYYLQANSF